MDLPGALSKESEKMLARSRHREKRADAGRELSGNLIAKSLSLRGVEEPGKDLGEKRVLSWELPKVSMGVSEKEKKCWSRTRPERKK